LVKSGEINDAKSIIAITQAAAVIHSKLGS
jgi:hypothetical protein